MLSFFKVVLSKSLAEVAQNVIKYVRLALLTPEELKQVELENEKDKMIPVSLRTLELLLSLNLLNGHSYCAVPEKYTYPPTEGF